MTTEFRNVCAELLAAIQLYTKLNPAASDMSPFELTEKLMDAMAASVAALAQPVAEGPTDEELADLMPTRFLVNQSASARAIANIGTDEQVAEVRAILDGEAMAYARAVLAKWGNQ